MVQPTRVTVSDGAGISPAGLEMALRPSIATIAMTREFVFDFATRVLDDVELGSRIAVAVHELLENCLKYSSDGEAVLSIALSEGHVSMRVENRAETSRIGALREALDELASAPNPKTFYTAALVRAAGRAQGSGLGLARIRAEADMALRGEFDGDRVALVVEV